MKISETLSRLRKENAFKQSEIASYITERLGKPCAAQSISHWENGVSVPSGEQLLALCEFYGIRDIQAEFSGLNMKKSDFDRLNALGKSRVKEYIAVLSGNPLFSEVQDDYDMFMQQRVMRLFDIPAAAGTGSFLDSYSYTELAVDETVPKDADFAIRISGDSMMPRFTDGQIVFIKEQNTLDIGETGIFSLDGNAYIKKLGQGELLSLNTEYEPIPIHEYNSFHIFGKVVG